MFTFTKLIFFIVIDTVLSIILIGFGIAVLALIIFLVSEFIKACRPSKNIKNQDKKG
jgi:hypothetical protein